MPAARTCSECGGSLAHKRPGSKTCTDHCRQKRSRRLKRHRSELGKNNHSNPEELRQLADYVRYEAPDVAKNIISDELRPVVREAITEDVLRAIDKMVSLTPRVVQAIEEDLHGEDQTLRQRAYTLVAKYTIGHHALVTPKDADPNQQLVVNFNLPRPDSQGGGSMEYDEPEELRTCDSCGQIKQGWDFVATSNRCQQCFDTQQGKIKELLGE